MPRPPSGTRARAKLLRAARQHRWETSPPWRSVNRPDNLELAVIEHSGDRQACGRQALWGALGARTRAEGQAVTEAFRIAIEIAEQQG